MFLGSILIMANQCLILTAIFGSEASINDDPASGVFATFTFFLCCVYSVFGIVLGVFRRDLVEINDGVLPPAAAAGDSANVGKPAVSGFTSV